MKHITLFFTAWVLYCMVYCLQLNAQIQKLQLDQKWQFKERGNTNWLPAQVPGTIHTDLMTHKKIADPFWRDNEKWVQWVSNLDWDYRCSFTVDAGFLANEQVELVLDGIDTYAEIMLNKKTVCKTQNMFLQYKTDVKSMLKPGENELIIRFASPYKAAMPKLLANPQTLPAINDDMQVKLSPYSRKAGYHYGWDWGPRLVTTGIWRPVYFVAWSNARVEHFNVSTTSISKNMANCKATVHANVNKPGRYQLRFRIDGKEHLKALQFEKGQQKAIAEFEVPKPKLWWPNGAGEQHLYRLDWQLWADNRVVDAGSSKVGLRTVELVHEMDGGGKSFFFKINGRPIFMKGANYIPQDNFLPRVDESRYQKLLSDTRDANMNMLRIWGGGIYENDVFYQLCDSLGICVWQDFMFACTMYPGDTAFFNNVEREVRYNIRRLAGYPSLVLWCGNNENETGWFKKWMRGSIPYSVNDSAQIYDDYKRLFHQKIPEICKEEDPSRFYHRSSPSANDDGILPDTKGFGDIHDWFVWFGTGDYRKYRKTISRFHSEYGYQSFPAMSTIRKFSEPQDWFADSEVMHVHQKHTNGNSKIRRFGAEFYSPATDFSSFIYQSQLQQAEAMKMAIESHRAAMPYCMGSLYWQLNDCWPVASWSGIDYFGTWKATHFFAKKANRPELPVLFLDGDTVKLYIINESGRAQKYQVGVNLRDIQSGQSKNVLSQSKDISDNASTLLQKWHKAELIAETQKGSNILSVKLQRKGMAPVENTLLFTEPKNLKLPQANIELKLTKLKTGYEVALSSSAFAKNVYLELKSGAGHFSDNFFDLWPDDTLRIFLHTTDNIKPDDIQIMMLK